MNQLSKYFFASLTLCLAFSAFSFVSARPQPLGTTQRDTILGVPCVVYLPHNYEGRITPEKRGFPCLYLQHGMFGSENDWTRAGHLMQWMDSLLREEMVEEMIIIMPDNFLGSIPPAERKALMEAPNVTPDGKPFSVEDGQHHWKKITRAQEQAYEMSGYWEEHFGEFQTEVERRYWIDARPKQRAIAGLSMGGFHSMHVSHYLTGIFDYIGLFSPVILPRETTDLVGKKKTFTSPKAEPVTITFSDGSGSVTVSPEEDGTVANESTEEKPSPFMTAGFDEQLPYSSPAYNDWMDDLRQMAQMPPLYYIAIGHDDFLYDQLQDYRKWLEMNHFEYVYYETDGGHTWKNWQDYLCHFLKCCFTRLW